MSGIHCAPLTRCSRAVRHTPFNAVATELEGPVNYVVFPTLLGLRSGTMPLADGHLRYTRNRRNRVVVRRAGNAFHSFALAAWGTEFHLWHAPNVTASRCTTPGRPPNTAPGVVADMTESIEERRRRYLRSSYRGAPTSRREHAQRRRALRLSTSRRGSESGGMLRGHRAQGGTAT